MRMGILSTTVFPFALRDQFLNWPRGLYIGSSHSVGYSESQDNHFRHFNKKGELIGYSRDEGPEVLHFDLTGNNIIGRSKEFGDTHQHFDASGEMVLFSVIDPSIEMAYLHYESKYFDPNFRESIHPSQIRTSGISSPHKNWLNLQNSISYRTQHLILHTNVPGAF